MPLVAAHSLFFKSKFLCLGARRRLFHRLAIVNRNNVLEVIFGAASRAVGKRFFQSLGRVPVRLQQTVYANRKIGTLTSAFATRCSNLLSSAISPAQAMRLCIVKRIGLGIDQ